MMMIFPRRTLLAFFVLVASIGQSNAQLFDQVLAFFSSEAFQNIVVQLCPTIQGLLSGFGFEISCDEVVPAPNEIPVAAPNKTPVAAPNETPVAAPNKKGKVAAVPVAAPAPTP